MLLNDIAWKLISTSNVWLTVVYLINSHSHFLDFPAPRAHLSPATHQILTLPASLAAKSGVMGPNNVT